MATPNQRLTRKLSIIAQDPAVRYNGKILRAEIEIPAERLLPGPCGYRIIVNPTANPACQIPIHRDPFATASDDRLLSDFRFHAQNTYAILMRTLARFEQALGRRVSWGFPGHQLRVATHAFQQANAYYSARTKSILLGYFPGSDGTVYTALSHDVIAHEGTHALVHGLRRRYFDPSSPDQAAFHEGFADIIALLSVFSLPSVVAALLGPTTLEPEQLSPEYLRRSLLFAMAQQMGQEISHVRGQALRHSIQIPPSAKWKRDPEFTQPHRRGEIPVAALMNALLEVWLKRLRQLGTLDAYRVAAEAADTADRLLSMSIRSLDFCPPTDILFPDFLSAMLTADREMSPDDSRFEFRKTILKSFARYGIRPTSKGDHGAWEPPEGRLRYDRSHLDSLQRDPDEVFRFLWENRRALGVREGSDTYVQSVRPATRVGADGFVLRETVAEYIQRMRLPAAALKSMAIRVPKGMPADHPVTLWGGGTLIFDEFGRLKVHVRNRIDNAERQNRRLAYLWALRQEHP